MTKALSMIKNNVDRWHQREKNSALSDHMNPVYTYWVFPLKRHSIQETENSIALWKECCRAVKREANKGIGVLHFKRQLEDILDCV